MESRPERKSTVLIVDDTPEDISVLREELKGEYRVQAALDHEAAIRLARSANPPDLILLDIMMPGMDGYQLCRELKAHEATRKIPVIFVTSKDDVENEAMGFASGCVDYITKPVNPLLVLARVKTHVALKLASEDLESQNAILRENAQLREEVEAIVRHDLKNPLTVVMTVPRTLLDDENLTEKQKSLLRLVDDAGHRMLEMINSSVDMYKMEKGTYELSPSTVNVLPIIERIKGVLARPMADKGVTCFVTWSGGHAEGSLLPVRGEDLLVYSMLGNLMKNAVEASPAGSQITITLRDGATAGISIHNLGAIPEKIRSRFFSKFATAGKERGTGLGAYSAKLIAATLGGSITFETSDEAGTTISVELPRT